MKGKAPELSRAEQRTLLYPPTPKTWLCRSKLATQGGETRECGAINAGGSACNGCGTPKRSARKKDLWPAYVVLCEKVGHEPGTRYPSRPTPAPAKKTRKGK